MNLKKSTFFQILLRKETPLFLIFIITGLALFGWLFGISIFTSFSLEYIPIAPSSTVMFITLSVLSLLNSNSGKSRTVQTITSLSLVVIALYCFLIFLDHLFNFPWDLEKFFISNPERFWNVLQGRMSPISSVLFIFSCTGLWGIKQNNSNIFKYVGGGSSLAVWLLSSVLLIGYMYKAPLLYGSQIIPIALPTAICFLLFSISLILQYKVKYWTLNLLNDNVITRQLLESFLPIVVSIVVLQGYLTTNYSINKNNPTFTAAVILLAVTVITIITVTRVSVILGTRILKVEKALSKSEGRYKTMIKQSPLGIALIDSVTDRIFEENPMFTQITGRTQEQLASTGWTTITHPNDKQEELDNMALLNAGKINEFQMEKRLLRSDDTIIWINMTIAPVNFDDIDNPRHLCMIEDFTERIKAEAEIKLKNEQLHAINATKDKFFSIIAHDLRGPLGAFIGLTEMMADESQYFPPDQKKDLTLTLNHSARNIFNLLENLLEWSQMQKGHTAFNPQIQGLKELFNESTKIVNDSARNKAIEISIDIPKELDVFADTNMLQTVIRNLVSNAIKFTRHGGMITISAGPGENNTAVIAVKDTGIGMSNEMLDNLFRIDVKSNRPGTEGEPSTGLGLLLCKEFVEKHGGKIWVESEEGKGSIFYFTLPYNGVPKEKIFIKNVDKEDRAERKINPEGSGLKILIAEDDKISEKLITMAVKRFSKEVINVRTGVEAVEAFRNNPDIDLVLMDIKMPEMDGYNAVRQIRQFNKDVIIIAQTALALDGDRDKAIQAGCNDYITKPIDKALLTELIKKHFQIL